jgi:alpha-glucosidase
MEICFNKQCFCIFTKNSNTFNMKNIHLRMNYFKIILFGAVVLAQLSIEKTCFASSNQEFDIKSPDENIKVTVSVTNTTNYTVNFYGDDVLVASPISMELDNGLILGKNATVKKFKKVSVSEEIEPVVKQKSAKISDIYNELRIDFRQGYSLVFRAYNDAVAFRWETALKTDFKVLNEEVSFRFDADYKIWFPEEESFLSHQERKYKYINLSDINEDRFGSTGMLVDLNNGFKAYISEADLLSYPGMFLKGSNTDPFALHGYFAHYPAQTKQTNDRTVEITRYDNYLATCKKQRAFPWRVIALTTDDAQLFTNEVIYKLASPCKLEDVSWIKPGKVAWDWWNDNNIYGVDFKSGINTETYKYYIDFASKYNLDYIILDEGWYDLKDVLKIKEEIDVKELIKYGQSKHVGIILWVTWKGLDDKLQEALDAYASWGAKGVKVDFMQRDDQWMVEYYEKVAREAAKRKLLVDFHGAYKPTGLRRAYPNVITREGVQGLEHCKWSADSDPEHNLTIPFIRQVAGPMDYTPGAMINATKKNFGDIFSSPMSLGTRCHQLGMYVVYESPLQMLADNPSNYYREPECMSFLSRVPTTWDETRVLSARVSDYVLIARRMGDGWYIGGMTDWSPRILKATLDFLDEGAYKIEIWQDGVNADRHASDYKYLSLPVDKTTELEVKMAPGGGFAAIISKAR